MARRPPRAGAGRCSATTVADAARLRPDDARLLLDASSGARRVSAGVRRALEADLRDDLAAAPMPVGLIWGAADRVVPYSGLEALRRLRPDALVETLPATGHIPQIERSGRASPPRSSGSSTRSTSTCAPERRTVTARRTCLTERQTLS